MLNPAKLAVVAALCAAASLALAPTLITPGYSAGKESGAMSP